MEKSILLDLANETARRYGDLASDFADKMARRIKRKFSTKIETQEISRFVFHVREIYKYGASILGEYLKPPQGKYADPRDVDAEKFLAGLVKEFPDDDRDVLSKISGWVVYYEYLR